MADINGSGDGACSDLEAKIIKQIEYYFGNMNLMRDRFLKEKIQEDDGWVTLETMLKFNRLKQMSNDAKIICEAMRKSKSGLMEVHENGDKIRRSPLRPLPGDTKERKEEITGRSIYAKSFPLDSSLDDLTAFFETYGAVDNIFMKRDFHKKTFKGSVFVTFVNKDIAEKFLKEEGTKYAEKELEQKLFKVDYFKEKAASKKKRDPKPDKPTEEPKKEENEEEKAKQQMTKNAVLHIDGIDPETSREDIKTFFSDHGDVGWVDYDKGCTKAYLRMKEPNSAGPALEKAKAAGEGKIVINSKEVEVRVVEGDEELEYWKKMFKDIAEKHEKMKKSGRDRRQGGGRFQRGGRRQRGGPQGKRKNRNDEDNGADDGSNEPPEKVAKAD